MKFISILLTMSIIAAQQIKDYSFTFDNLENNSIKFIAPKGSNLAITASKTNEFKIKMRIEVPDKFKEFYEKLPEKPSILRKLGSNASFDFSFVLKTLSKESDSFFGSLFSKIKGDGDMELNGTRYYVENGKRYEVFSHFISMEIEAPRSSQFFVKHRYGKMSIEGLQSKELQIDSYESDLSVKKVSGNLIVENKYNLTHISDIQGDADIDLYESVCEVFNISGHLNFENKYKETAIRNITNGANVKLYSSEAIIEAITGRLKIENKYSPTTIQSIKGELKGEFYESILKIYDVSGDLEIENKYKESTIENVAGNVSISLYESRTSFKNIQGNLSGSSKYEPLSIGKIQGNLNLELYESPIQIESEGSIKLNAKYGDVKLIGKPKDIDIESYSANLNLNLYESFSSPILIKSKYGHVRIYDMTIEKFRIKAKAKDGRVDIKDLETDDDEKIIKYQWYKKNLILADIETYDGNIIIK